ncbi:hypothetical protein [Peterkaempfera bronchialis]|uniref:Uncharacterized protein n=1 Tax=Peterkaempfera bronchialis TaxID=2126346 RepID=A0A345SRW3_9ACTN|nr:hypothetical protein [Peterkaempfera bronchialis]AXI76468.1 hypothetical protein C7M71_002240 [Peterkaempfera bronchialis]
MAITETGRPATAAPAAPARGFLVGGTAGCGLACLVVAPITGKVPLAVAGVGLLLLMGLVPAVSAHLRRARTPRMPVDSAPESTTVEALPDGASCGMGILGFLIGAAVVVLLCRAELFANDTAHPSPSSRSTLTVTASGASSSGASSSGASSSVTTVSVTTVSGPEGAMLRDREIRRLAESMTAAAGTSQVSELTIEDGRMTMRTAAAPPPPGIDLRSLPYERLPVLVAEARTTLGIRNPVSWRIGCTQDATTKALVIRVTVSDQHGAASLEADAREEVTVRHSR